MLYCGRRGSSASLGTVPSAARQKLHYPPPPPPVPPFFRDPFSFSTCGGNSRPLSCIRLLARPLLLLPMPRPCPLRLALIRLHPRIQLTYFLARQGFPWRHLSYTRHFPRDTAAPIPHAAWPLRGRPGPSWWLPEPETKKRGPATNHQGQTSKRATSTKSGPPCAQGGGPSPHAPLSLHSFALLCVALFGISLHWFAMLCVAVYCFALPCVVLHGFALPCVALLCDVLRCYRWRCFQVCSLMVSGKTGVCRGGGFIGGGGAFQGKGRFSD